MEPTKLISIRTPPTISNIHEKSIRDVTKSIVRSEELTLNNLARGVPDREGRVRARLVRDDGSVPCIICSDHATSKEIATSEYKQHSLCLKHNLVVKVIGFEEKVTQLFKKP